MGPRDLRHFKFRAELLCQIYSKSTLALLIFYLEHAIKCGLAEDLQLTELGPGDIASQLIQFFRIFAEDADAGTASTAATDRQKNKAKGGGDSGGWNNGTPTGTPRAGSRATSLDGEAEVDTDKAAEDKKYLVYRPFQLVG